MALAYWNSHNPKAAQSHGSSSATDSQQHCFVYTMHSVDLCTCVCFQWCPRCTRPGQSLSALSAPASLFACLSWLHPDEAKAAVLVKRFVYPIRMMKRPFISTLPPARRWQELYLDKPLKHTARHETAPSEEIRGRYTHRLTDKHSLLLTNTNTHSHTMTLGREGTDKTGTFCC